MKDRFAGVGVLGWMFVRIKRALTGVAACTAKRARARWWWWWGIYVG